MRLIWCVGLLYRAPELLRLADPPLQGTQKGDIYSFGILLYAIHGRQGPFGFTPLNPNDIMTKVMEYTPPQPPFRSVPIDLSSLSSFSILNSRFIAYDQMAIEVRVRVSSLCF